MIREVTGDILLSKAHLIAHGVAPHDDFKSGLALSLREHFPGLYKDFRHWCKTHSPRPGEVWVWSGVGEAGRAMHIACLLTQEPSEREGGHPGRAKPSYVNKALHELRKTIEREHFESLALPRLATGVGGLEWNDVRTLIVSALETLDVPIVVYTNFKKGVAASEPLPTARA
ncbi:MAG: macro domain-containing protein [Planctomycetes bacterium]|nr:macro domain-containing protein [Planctomycetota bacterium]